jgi:hypothetical protein
MKLKLQTEEMVNAVTMAFPIQAFLKNRKKCKIRTYESIFLTNMAASLAFHSTAMVKGPNDSRVKVLRAIDIACIHALSIAIGNAALHGNGNGNGHPKKKNIWNMVIIPLNVFSYLANGGLTERNDRHKVRTLVAALTLSPLFNNFRGRFFEITRMLFYGAGAAFAYTKSSHPVFHVFLGPFVGSIARLLKL